MKFVGKLSLRSREFQVTEAQVSKSGDFWIVEVETLDEEFDGERWRPRLYHQGLKLSAMRVEELPGISTSWAKSGEPTYPHPELGIMYVFGHESVYDSTLRFGPFEDATIALEWEGLCDVFWDEEFSDKVPFTLRCAAAISDV